MQAELYKLLVYDTGSFVVGHRDSEKASGMFATLVVVLPSDYSRPSLGALPFYPDELSPPDALDALEPDELNFQDAAGNEGASFDRLYQRAALVLWPPSRRIAVLAQGGLEVTAPFLGGLARQWRDAGPEVPLWQEAHQLAAQIRRDRPDTLWGRQRTSAGGQDLQHLARLDGETGQSAPHR